MLYKYLTSLISLLFVFTCSSAQTIIPVTTNGPYNISAPVVMGSHFYFRGEQLDQVGLYKSDGTETGTELVKAIGMATIFAAEMPVAHNGYLYFSGYDFVNGSEIWKSDGTSEGTVMIIDINPDGNSYPNNFTIFKNEVYFQASGRVWKTDGTEEGTLQLGTNGIYSAPEFIVFKDELYFPGFDAVNGVELWKTNGTNEGTVLVKDIDANLSNGSMPTNYCIFNNELYFAAYTDNESRELWKTNGMADGTIMVKDIHTVYNSSPLDFTVFNTELFFSATDDIYGRELWKTDGTTEGTKIVKDINTFTDGDPTQFTIFNNKLVFSGNYGLFESDGTTSGTKSFANVSSANYSYANTLYNFNNRLYFAVGDISTSRLWSTDGTNIGTSMVDVNQQINKPIHFFTFNNTLYFAGDKGKGLELMKLSSLTGTKSLTNEESISIFPSPCHDQLVINADFSVKKVVISNYLNQTVEEIIWQGNSTMEISLEGTASGMYFITLVNDQNETQVKRFFKR